MRVSAGEMLVGSYADRSRDGVAHQMADLLGLATPEPVLVVVPSKVAARRLNRALIADLGGDRLAAGPRLRALGLRGEEQPSVPFADGGLMPLLVKFGSNLCFDAFNTKSSDPGL